MGQAHPRATRAAATLCSGDDVTESGQGPERLNEGLRLGRPSREDCTSAQPLLPAA